MPKAFRFFTFLLALLAGISLTRVSGPQRAFAEDPRPSVCWTTASGTNETVPSTTIRASLTEETQDGPHGPIEWFKLTAQNAQLAGYNPNLILIKAYVEEGKDVHDLDALVVRSLLAMAQPREALLYLTSPVIRQYLQIQAATVGIRVPARVIGESGIDPFELDWQLRKLAAIKATISKPTLGLAGGYRLTVRDPALGPREVEISPLIMPPSEAIDWVDGIYYYGPFSDMTDEDWSDYYYLLDWIEGVEDLTEQYYQSLPIDERTKVSTPFSLRPLTLEKLIIDTRSDIIAIRDTGEGTHDGLLTTPQVSKLLRTTNIEGETTSIVDIIRCPQVIDSTVHNLLIGSVGGPAPARGAGKD